MGQEKDRIKLGDEVYTFSDNRVIKTTVNKIRTVTIEELHPSTKKGSPNYREVYGDVTYFLYNGGVNNLLERSRENIFLSQEELLNSFYDIRP